MIEHRRGTDEGRDCQTIPVRQNLVVSTGSDARIPCGEKLGTRARQPRLLIRRSCRGQPAQNGMPLPVPRFGHIVSRHERRRIEAEQADHLPLGPDIKFSLHALAVGILRGGKSRTPVYLRRSHVADHPSHRLGGPVTIQCVRSICVGAGEKLQQLRVVVEHFFEMRHQPDIVGGIPRKTAAEMIVNATLRHAFQQHVGGGTAGAGARSEIVLPQKSEDRRVREFRRATKTAVNRIGHAQQRGSDMIEIGRPR